VSSSDQDKSFKPGSTAAAGFNVVICAGLVIAMPIYAFAAKLEGPDLAIAGGAFVVAVGMEISFIRALRKRRSSK